MFYIDFGLSGCAKGDLVKTPGFPCQCDQRSVDSLALALLSRL